MELAMHIISNDKTVRSNIVQDLKEFNSQSLSTQAKKGELLVSMMPSIKRSFWFNGWWYSRIIYRKRKSRLPRWKMVRRIKVFKTVGWWEKSKFVYV